MWGDKFGELVKREKFKNFSLCIKIDKLIKWKMEKFDEFVKKGKV